MLLFNLRDDARPRDTAEAALGFVQTMKYHGVSYSIIQGNTPDVWRWSVMVGQPEMLRIGDAPTEQQAEAQVQQVIDRALTVQQTLRSLKLKRQR